MYSTITRINTNVHEAVKHVDLVIVTALEQRIAVYVMVAIGSFTIKIASKTISHEKCVGVCIDVKIVTHWLTGKRDVELKEMMTLWKTISVEKCIATYAKRTLQNH